MAADITMSLCNSELTAEISRAGKLPRPADLGGWCKQWSRCLFSLCQLPAKPGRLRWAVAAVRRGLLWRLASLLRMAVSYWESLELVPAAHLYTLVIQKLLSAAFSIEAEIRFFWRQSGEVELAHKITSSAWTNCQTLPAPRCSCPLFRATMSCLVWQGLLRIASDRRPDPQCLRFSILRVTLSLFPWKIL